MLELPTVEAPPERVHRAALRLRYEDVAQDGRLKLEPIPAALGVTIWQGMLTRSEEGAIFRREGVVPILRRFVIVGTDAPLSVHRPLETEGRWQMAHTAGERVRFLLNMRVDLRGPRGRTHGPPPERAGELASVGGVYAEHVFTRLFAPKEERRVEALPAGLDAGPEREWVPQEALMRPAVADAERVDPAPVERGEVFFSLCHTDSNQHVNSLIYPRLFEERAIAAWGEGERLMRAIDIAWHKPSFAGERLHVSVQRLRAGERRGAVVVLQGADEPRPRCVAQLWLG